jgi:hypothetical protein
MPHGLPLIIFRTYCVGVRENEEKKKKIVYLRMMISSCVHIYIEMSMHVCMIAFCLLPQCLFYFIRLMFKGGHSKERESNSRSSLALLVSTRSFFNTSYHSRLIDDLDETRLTQKRTSECYQHSTPLATGNIALFASQTNSSSPLYYNRRRQTSVGQMTSYSALKRKAQRADVSASGSRVSTLP